MTTSGLWTPGTPAAAKPSAPLWLPPKVAHLRHRATKRTVTLANGKRVLVTVDDSGTVTHIEHDDHRDAIVRPQTIRLKVQRFWGPHGHPKPVGPLEGKEGTYGPGRRARG